ncbi:MAG: hypothetical protein LC122_11680 [Chitinophagales bacterium]|nr:hypothetical protein [Chitinophagales bacterium]
MYLYESFKKNICPACGSALEKKCVGKSISGADVSYDSCINTYCWFHIYLDSKYVELDIYTRKSIIKSKELYIHCDFLNVIDIEYGFRYYIGNKEIKDSFYSSEDLEFWSIIMFLQKHYYYKAIE